MATAACNCYSIIILWLLPVEENPSWLQATLASSTPQRSSHTVPHVPLMQTSTRPSKKVEPPTSLTSPSVQSVCFYEFSHAYTMYIMFISKHELTEYGQTPGTNILIMTTVRAAQWISLTINQIILSSKTNNIVKPDWFARTITKVGLSWCASTCNEKGI